MAKIFSLAVVCFSSLAFAQIKFAGKANVLFPTNSPSWTDMSTAVDFSGKNATGFNVGISAKIDLPTAFFLMPEVYYTTFKNEFTERTSNVTLEAKYNRIDVPVLVGYKLLGDTFGVFIGPVASYNLSTDNQYQDFQENAAKEFTVGYQFGAQIQLQKLIINGRYEGAFTEDQRTFVKNVAGSKTTVRYDNRPSLVSVGLGYQF